MDSTMTQRRDAQALRQAGFSLAEVMIAGAIITIGLLTVLGLFGTALAATQASQLDEIAHARATQTLESIYTARQTSQFGFAAIDNTTAASGKGQFTAGMVTMTDPGPDGLDGTSDDVPAAPIVLPGPDGILGTSDDITISLSSFQRQIAISNAINPLSGATEPNLKQVIVTIQYPGTGGRIRTYTVQTLVSAFH
jgi:type II secretory pathway pseudopilin PulG